jgi:hypothetical protein
MQTQIECSVCEKVERVMEQGARAASRPGLPSVAFTTACCDCKDCCVHTIKSYEVNNTHDNVYFCLNASSDSVEINGRGWRSEDNAKLRS